MTRVARQPVGHAPVVAARHVRVAVAVQLPAVRRGVGGGFAGMLNRKFRKNQ